MSREKEDYKDNLEMLKVKFGDVATIPLKEVAKYIGKCERSLKEDKNFPIKKIKSSYVVPVVGLAKWLS